MRGVLTGHVHNYQRSRPIAFQPAGDAKPGGLVPGACKIDPAKGIVYLLSGAGGHDLIGDGGPGDDCTHNDAFHSGESFTVMQVSDAKVAFQQIDGEGKQVDSWEIVKNEIVKK